MAVVVSTSWLVGSHYCAMTVMVPDDRLEDYFCVEIRRWKDGTHLIPRIKEAQLPDHVKENLLLNIEIRRRENETRRQETEV